MLGMTAISGWENFYVIVGSSAGALIGLQFVAITLIADRPISASQVQAGSAFATPTIVHFCAVLLLSAILSSPWQGVGSAAVLWGVMGLAGIIYEIIVTLRMRRTAYRPEFEDWLCHSVLPFVAYSTLAASAFAAQAHAHGAMFGVAAAALLLLSVGIHNAWDAVTYHVFVKRHLQQQKAERAAEESAKTDA